MSPHFLKRAFPSSDSNSSLARWTQIEASPSSVASKSIFPKQSEPSYTAVGKSSLVNALAGKELMETGEIGEKSGRGKHTTRHVEIIEFEDGTMIADTCGFSMFEIPLFDPMFLASYYIDFDKYRENCRFRGCTHTVEECCGVKEAVELGKIPKERYERYLKLYEEFNKRWEKRYG